MQSNSRCLHRRDHFWNDIHTKIIDSLKHWNFFSFIFRMEVGDVMTSKCGAEEEEKMSKKLSGKNFQMQTQRKGTKKNRSKFELFLSVVYIVAYLLLTNRSELTHK